MARNTSVLSSESPPDYRWRKCVDLYKRGSPASIHFGDEWICRGTAFLTRLRACKSPDEHQALQTEFPDIAAAYQLYEEPDRITRAVPQARLLAGLSIDEIAAAQNVPAAAIVAYEKLFFSVLDRFRQSAYIIGAAIDRRIYSHELTMKDGDAFLKWFAYSYGPDTIEPTLDYFRNGLVIPKDLDHTPVDELKRLLSRLEMHALILLCVLPGQKAFKAVRIMEMAGRIERLIDSRSPPASDAVTECPLIWRFVEDALKSEIWLGKK